MILPISNIQNVLRTYDRQLRVARLNSEIKRAVIQRQVDRVEISEEGRQMLDQKPQPNAPAAAPARNLNQNSKTPDASGSAALDVVEDDDFFF